MSRKKSLSYFKEKLDNSICQSGLNHSFKRDLLLEALYKQEVPLSMDDLYFAVNSGLKKIVSINSVYRNIKLFVKLNLAVRTGQDGSFKYILNCLDDTKIELVCSKCGMRRAIEQKNDVKHAISMLLEEEGFNGSEQNVKVVSLCQHCALSSHGKNHP